MESMRNLSLISLILGISVTFTNCGGGGSSPPVTGVPPTVSLSSNSIDVFVGQPITLTWSSTGATSCNAGGAWSGTQPVSGSQSVTPTTAGNSTYTLTCMGAGGSANESVMIGATTPSLSLTDT